MKNNRLLRAAALIALVIPSWILLSRHHARALRARRVAQLQGYLERAWALPLRRDASAPEMDEYEAITAVSRQTGVSDLVYFNKYAEVRWSEDSTAATIELSDYASRHFLPKSVIDAHTVRLPFIDPLPGGTSHSFAIPLNDRGFFQGLIYFQATDEALSALIDRGPQLFPPATSRPDRTGRDEARQESDRGYLNGLIYFQRGQRDRARMNWERAVALDPSNEDARLGLERLQ